MDLKNNITMIIHSCDKFSDLWDAHITQLEKYWPNRDIPTYIVTDKQNKRNYKKVTVLATGEGKELSERTAIALEQIDTDFVFITLDDYFLMKPVSNEAISHLLEMMEKESFDYVRLWRWPKCKNNAKIKKYKKIYRIDTNECYSVNLYAGIWRKSFLQSTIREPKNAWRYEVSLARRAREYGARCVMSDNKEFVILDTVRKGKFLNKAYKFLKKHDLYNGDRAVNTHWYEFKLNVRTWGIRIMPKWVTKKVRDFMIKRGHHYYSEEQ